MNKTHTLLPTPRTVHWGHFDAALSPVLEIESGDTVVVDTVSGGLEDAIQPERMRPEHRLIAETVPQIMGPHILTGPIAIRGAQPGDTLEVRILDIELTQDWAWNVIRPLKGTLPEEFPHLSRRVIPLNRQAGIAHLPWGADIPLRPFFGIMGVAPPASYGRVSSIEPREFGGNIDNKELIPGSSLFLPVFVPGALFSAGDGHAVQGDGEVCLTALETSMKGRFQFVLHKAPLNFPRALTPTHYITMGMDPDLDDAARQALRHMLDWIVALKGWSREQAYVFCSLACDLHVTQLVDGNKGIHAMVRRELLDPLRT